jgi:sialic acid synthase SpsE
MPNVIHIDGRTIGPSERCFVIAEACDNHLGDIKVAKEMVRQAKACGVDAIKFQHHLPEEEMLRDGVPMSANFNIPLYEFLERYALKLDQHYELYRYCKELGIIYLCTPFSRKAAEEINTMGVGAFKIGSGELTDLPTLKVVAKFGKPMILSTGMAEWHEIDETIETLRPINDQIVLMNCVSEYPARHADVNLNVIREMERRYDVIVGHSDHTPDIYTSIGSNSHWETTRKSTIWKSRYVLGPIAASFPYARSQRVRGSRRTWSGPNGREPESRRSILKKLSPVQRSATSPPII